MPRLIALRGCGVRDALRISVERFPRMALPIRAWNQRRTGRQEPELALLRWLVDPHRVAVDVGANRGVYTWELARLTDKTWAIEANPEHLRFLQRIAPERVTVVHAAASNVGGMLRLRIPQGVRQASGLSTVEASNRWEAGKRFSIVDVPATRLDDLLAHQDVGFLKIDVEGHELAVLQGCRDLLARCRPVLLVEAEDRHRPGAVESIVKLLGILGYVGFMMRQGRLAPIELFRVDEHQIVSDPERLDLGLGHPSYVNNFIFLPGLTPA